MDATAVLPSRWCDGSAVRPWVVDVSVGVDWVGKGAFNVSYRATFNGGDPNPVPQQNMPYIIVHAYLAFS